MSLDSLGALTYTEGGRSHTSEIGDATMIVFLSFPNNGNNYRNVERILRSRGLRVLTNFDSADSSLSAEQRTDARLQRIRSSRVFVFFAPSVPRDRSLIRQIELGYALGSEIPLVFVGNPLNSLHSYDDVFETVEDFLAEFYSERYNERAEQLCQSAKVA